MFFKQIGQLLQGQTSQLLGYVLTAAESGYEERGQMDTTIQNFQDQLFYLQVRTLGECGGGECGGGESGVRLRGETAVRLR